MRADRTICKIKSDVYAIGIWWQFSLTKKMDTHGYLLITSKPEQIQRFNF